MPTEMNQPAFEEWKNDPEGPIGSILDQYAYQVENAAKLLLAHQGGGGFYDPGVKFFRRGPKVYRWERLSAHVASAPGEPPASDSGLLLSSVHHSAPALEAGGEHGSDLVSHIGSDVKEARFTELGTRYMAPRPWLRPALDIGLSS